MIYILASSAPLIARVGGATDLGIWTLILVPLFVALLGGGFVQWLLVRRPLKAKEEVEDRARIKNAATARRERLEQAHFRAAELHAGQVAEAFWRLDAIAMELLGPDSDFFNVEQPGPVDARDYAAKAIQALRQIWTSHPTAAVRQAAKNLYESLGAFYGELLPGDFQRPTSADREALLDHRAQAERLVELLHRLPADETSLAGSRESPARGEA
jgi:hypothetical protein